MDISPKLIVVNDLTATTGGNLTVETGTFTIGAGVAADTFVKYRLIGTPTLTSDLDIVANGTLVKNLYVEFYNEAVIDGVTNNKDLTIFGATVPKELIAVNFKAECLYSGTAWVIYIIPDWEATSTVNADRIEADAVTESKIIDDAVTLAKMAGLAKGTIIFGNASGNPTASSASTDGQIFVGETATGGDFQTVSGVITVSKAGLTAFAAGAVTDAAVTSISGAKITTDDTIASRKLSDTGILASGFADVGTAADTVKVTALTGSIALGTLDDGDKVVLECQVDAANTATVKTVRVEVDGNAITMNPVTTSPQNVNMIFRVTIQRASNTSALVYGTMVNGIVAETITSKPAITNFDTTAVPILVTIQNGTANANDLIFKGGSFTEFRG